MRQPDLHVLPALVGHVAAGYVTNRRAIALYESLGFHLDGVRKAYYPAVGEREDALLYSLRLTHNFADNDVG